MPKRTFDDLVVGQSFALPPHTFTREEIIAFAREYDPQPFHLADDAPESKLIGGLIASGWHICAVFMRMLCDGLLLDAACLGSPGIDTLKWQRPVRPGDTLTGKSTVLEARVSKSRPDRGITRFRHEVTNQAGDIVMWMENPILFAVGTPA